jgi:hypothetical protein
MSDTQNAPANDIGVILPTAAPPGFSPDSAAMTKIDGRESVLRCMEMYANRPGVAQIIVTINSADAEEIKRKIGSHLIFMGVKLVQAGAGWVEQLAAAQKVLKAEAKHVLVHDAGRPAVPYTDLDRLTALAGKHPAVALGRQVRGTFAKTKIVPGPAEPASFDIAETLGVTLYDRATFDTIAAGKAPTKIELIDGSPLNARCGWTDAGIVKALVSQLPKPKVKANSPFEEAQW